MKSVAKLAKCVGIQQSTLHRITSGETKDPTYSTLKTIADYFGRTPTELMECDLGEIDGAYPRIHITDVTPKSKFKALPSEIKTAVIDAYKEIVMREVKAFHDPSGISHQTARLENLAESLVNGFSKLIES
ncbi:helix-turn-helix domain-containing protein [Xenorhabdus szentirmaii]|nr:MULTISPECIES: helix-turn-helix transcriptional regulator [Xenorhabdus]MBD2803473.1 helix-turn-helix transcriptional regulator [Xenorhabdus sp. ZM]